MTYLAPNSVQARDIASIVHPQTNLVPHLEEGPMVDRRRRGLLSLPTTTARVSRRGRGAVVRVARLCVGAAGAGGVRADAQAWLLPSVSRHDAGERGRSGGETIVDRAGADEQGAVPMLRLRGERYRDQAGVVLPRRDRQAGKAQDHRPAHGVSRQHLGLDLGVGQARHARRFRPAVPGVPAHRIPALLPPPRNRRKRGTVRHAHGRRAGTTDPARGSGNLRRLHRRAGDGRGRRDRAASHLLGEDAGGHSQIRHAVHRRRGDLRVRPHRQHVGQPDLRSAARHDLLRQGVVGGDAADLGGADQPADLRRDAGRKPQTGEFRARFHLCAAIR